MVVINKYFNDMVIASVIMELSTSYPLTIT